MDFWRIAMKIRKRAFVLFVGYVWTKLLVGFIIHPYKSIRETASAHIFLPVVFSPLYALCLLFIMGRLGTLLFDIYGFKREIIALILSTGLFSIVMWQIILVYFFIHFVRQKTS